MELKELINELRKYELRIRKAIDTQMHGDFKSVFKGSGLEFDDVRAYQYGDDVRAIDWNVTAKGQGTYVKTFKEEKEQNVFFILDVSASQYIGRPNFQKIDIGRKICGILTISAVKENNSVGLLCFSDQRESYIKPKKGIKHAFQVISKLLHIEPKSLKTNLNKAMSMAMNIIQRRSVIVIISDFVDEGYDSRLKALARRHDLIVVHLVDPRERTFPRAGIIPILEKESGKRIWVNSNSKTSRQRILGNFERNQKELRDLCLRNRANYLYIDTQEDYVSKLVKLFHVRNAGGRK